MGKYKYGSISEKEYKETAKDLLFMGQLTFLACYGIYKIFKKQKKNDNTFTGKKPFNKQ